MVYQGPVHEVVVCHGPGIMEGCPPLPVSQIDQLGEIVTQVPGSVLIEF